MSYATSFYKTAREIASSANLNAVIAFPREIDGVRMLEMDLMENPDTNPFVAITEHLNEDTLELALLLINEGRFPVFVIDDTSNKMPGEMRHAIQRAILGGRKGFVILRKPLRKTGLEEIVEINLVDQTVYG